ncbi:hypothetical protein AB4Z21_28790 [Paenibacillus sp. MCAF20]
MAINYGFTEQGKAGRRLLAQVMAARQWAEMKRNRRFKREKSDKQPYKPGKTVLGLSSVSEAIGQEYDSIIPRRERRAHERKVSKGNRELVAAGLIRANDIEPALVFYNDEGPVRVPHNVNPHRTSRRLRNA